MLQERGAVRGRRRVVKIEGLRGAGKVPSIIDAWRLIVEQERRPESREIDDPRRGRSGARARAVQSRDEGARPSGFFRRSDVRGVRFRLRGNLIRDCVNATTPRYPHHTPMKFVSLALAALALTTSSIFIAVHGRHRPGGGWGRSVGRRSVWAHVGPTSRAAARRRPERAATERRQRSGGNGAGGSGAGCSPLQHRQDCANTCAPVASGSNCCSSNKCYVSSQPVCPSSSRRKQQQRPDVLSSGGGAAFGRLPAPAWVFREGFSAS